MNKQIKNDPHSAIIAGVLILIGVGFWGWVFFKGASDKQLQQTKGQIHAREVSSQASETRTIEAVKTPAQKRQEKIEAQFSSWDGSHRALVSYLKEHLNDPGSYQHVKTTYRDAGAVGVDMLLVECTYRAKNAFGALVLGQVVAVVDLDGRLVEVKTQSLR